MQTHFLNARSIVAFAAIAALMGGCTGGGGSSSGTPTAPETGAGPAAPAASIAAFTRNNTGGQDLHDHWQDDSGARAALGLGSSTGSRANLSSIARSAGNVPEDSRALLRNAPAGAVDPIGERNGITAGHWTAGPGGTLDIDFDWGAPRYTAAQRAVFEQLGKTLTYRLGDDFPARTVPAGSYPTTENIVTITRATEADDVLVRVEESLASSPQHDAFGGVNLRTAGDNDHVNPWFGLLLLPDSGFERIGNPVDRNDARGIVHELLHILGIITPGPAGHPNNQIPAIYDRLLDRENGTFIGEHAMAANGGQPVAFRRYTSSGHNVPVGTPGARIDYAHIANCGSIMAYCDEAEGAVFTPAELDYAILRDLGYDVLPARTANQPEVYGYGAWGTYSAWGAGVERDLDMNQQGTVFRIRDTLGAFADAFGIDPSEDFTTAHQGMTGNAVWTGILTGVDTGRTFLPPVFGTAELNVDLGTLDADLSFDNLRAVIDGTPVPFRTATLEYDVNITANGFSDANDIIDGAFYGPGHEEMAGTVDDPSSRTGLLAGFGGAR